VKQGMAGDFVADARNAPSVIAGSSDPLLEWAVRESRCGLAMLTYGSADGFNRLLSGEACAAAVHLPVTPASVQVGLEPNKFAAQGRLSHLDCALLRWAQREQGLVVASKNPKKIKSLADLRKRSVRTIARQHGAGSYLLLLELLKAQSIAPDDLNYVRPSAQTEGDIAAAILDGRADAGLAVRAVAQQFHLDFIPMAIEQMDIAVLRASYFDAPVQRLFEFTKTAMFKKYAKSLGGYDLTELGKVVWNA
jgi:putative molybdopterin biosynthesis protein